MSYFSRHCDTTQFTLTHHTVNKPFLLLGLAAEYRSRRRRRRCANNIAADHQMFITLTGRLSWQRLRRSAVGLYSKAKKSLFEPPFMALRDNVRTPSMARWKARGRLYIRRNWTFFAISYGWDVGVFRRGWVTLNADFRGKGPSPTNHSWYQSSRVIALSCGIKNICSASFSFATMHACDRQTDRQTDGRTELRLPRPPSHMLAR